MTMLPLNIRADYKQSSIDAYETSLVAVAASVNEGASVQWDVSLNKNGGPNAIYTFRVRTVQPSLPAGTYSQTAPEACAAVNEAGITFIGNGQPTDLTFQVNPALFDGTFRISRATTNIAGNQGAITSISHASPLVVTEPVAHGMQNDQPIQLTTDGALNGGLTANTTVYVRNKTNTTYELALTAGGASINSSGAGSGTHRRHLMSGLLIEAVSAGINGTLTGQLIKIVDTFSAVVPGNLASITLDTDLVDRWGVGLTSPAGTVVGSFVFKDEAANVLTPGAGALVFATGGNPDSRWEIFDAGSGASRYKLRHTAVVADFEDSPAPRHKINYPISVIGTISPAPAVQAALFLRPREQLVDPPDVLGPVTFCDTGEEFRVAMGLNPGNDRRIEFSPGVAGVLQPDTFPQIIAGNKIRGSRLHIKSNEHVVWHAGIGLTVAGKVGGQVDVIIEDLAVGPGHYEGAEVDKAIRTDIDAALTYADNLTDNWLQRIILKRFVGFASTDEIFDTIGLNRPQAPRSVRATRGIFAYALYEALHSTGFHHNHGISLSDYSVGSMLDHNIMWGLDTRDPQINGSCAIPIFNNLIGFWNHLTLGASRIAGSRGDTWQEAVPGSSWIEGNLYNARGAAEKAVVLNYDLINKVNSWHYQANNHFIDIAANNFADDLITESNGIRHTNCSDASVLRATPGFAVAGYTLDPTALEADRRALLADLLATCGNGSLFCQHVLAQVAAGIADENVTPNRLKALFGNGSPPWSGNWVTNRAAVACATTANITLSGEQTIDGVLTSGSRVLVWKQTNTTQNGIYVSGAGAWARATDMDVSSEFPGACFVVSGGSTNAGTWTCGNQSNPTVGTTAIAFYKALGHGVCA